MRARLHLPNKPSNAEVIQNTMRRLNTAGKSPPAPRLPKVKVTTPGISNEKEKV